MNVSLVATSDRQIEELLRACGAHVNVITADDLAALARPSAKQPDAIVVDQRDRPAIPPALAAIKRAHPSTGILIVLPRLDTAIMLEAMRAGVNECLAEPLNLEELKATIQRVAASRKAGHTGDVFAILGAKGGVGATTLAVNVATTLNKLRPGSTLLIDLHLANGDAGLFLGADPRFSIVDALENMQRMDATFLRTLVTQTKSGLHILASSDRPFVAAAVTATRALIELAATQFAYVVLDVPRSDGVMLDSLEAASTIVLVANQELATVRSAGRIAASMQQRYGEDRVQLVITRYDERSEIGQKDVKRVVGRPVSFVFPNNYAQALSSLNKGRPLVLDSPSKLGSAITAFARTLARLPAEVEREKSTGFLGLIAGRSR